jgi:probable HAF family extracellular repeat protein
MEDPPRSGIFYREHGSAAHFVQRMLPVNFVLLTAAIVTFVPRTKAGTTYTITDLGNGGLSSASGLAINNEGEVAGVQTLVVPVPGEPLENIYTNAFIAPPGGAMTSITPVLSVAGINDFGDMAGTYGQFQAFFYSSGSGVVDLGTDGGAYRFGAASGINNAGQVVGNLSQIAGGLGQPFVYTRASGLQPLTYAPNQLSITNATGINNSGQIIGVDSNGDAAVYSLNTGMVQDLGTIGSGGSTPVAINDSGQVVGLYEYISSPTQFDRGFIYTPGVGMTDLGTFFPNAINDSGEMVGGAGGYAFAYSLSTGLVNLNSIVDSLGWKLTSANAINNLGQITGEGLDPSGQDVAYVLTPVPEPSAVTLLLACTTLLVRRKQRF